jgi:hypothetical protein
MAETNDRIDQLINKLDTLLKRQEIFSKEISDIQEELNQLKREKTELEREIAEPIPEKITPVIPDQKNEQADSVIIIAKAEEKPIVKTVVKESKSEDIKDDLEKFIGENLINKIGIAITVIGVAIGTKYAIDHQLISPLTRILLGYLFGLGLFGFAIGMKKKYENFSAVLLSGSMTIMYFITFTAYSLYNLIPQTYTFVLMVLFTVVTVTAAINYNKEVIAHIGLVGAYAVPFLLSDGSGRVLILFSYMAIINVGILFIAFKKYWKPLYYSSFLLTWIIYLSWFGSKYLAGEHFGSALGFLSGFFVIFYLMFLAYKLIQKEKFDIYDIILLLTNAFIFYGVGYKILAGNDTGKHILGLFTLSNAVIHSLISIVIYRQKLADRNVFFLVSGLALVFITISIPVQLNGNWVTLLWAGEAALLFWIGRTKKVQFYEVLSYVLMLFAFISILQDWGAVHDLIESGQPDNNPTPLFNIGFLSSMLFVIAFAFINILNHNQKFPSPFNSQDDLKNLISFSISTILVITLYYSFLNEISSYWVRLYNASLIELKTAGQELPYKFRDNDILKFKNIWIINYSILFLSLLSLANIKKFKSRNLGYINLCFNSVILIIYLIAGLYILSELRDSYLNQTLSEYYHRGIFNIGIRYISFVFVGLIIISSGMYIDKEFIKPVTFNIKVTFDLVLYTSLIWIISSEMISWMDINHFSQTYKLGLSILWGVYALFLIVLGIWKKKKHLRIGAIVLFTLTLMKLFLYDISHLDTILKTVIFITLGILLLIISFLYIKYKDIISDDTDS